MMMRFSRHKVAAVLIVLACTGHRPSAQRVVADVPLDVFGRAASSSAQEATAALAQIAAGWKPGYAAMILDLAELSRPASAAATAAPLRFPSRREDPNELDRPALDPARGRARREGYVARA